MKLYDKLLNIYTTQYDNFLEDLKKRVDVLNKHEILSYRSEITTEPGKKDNNLDYLLLDPTFRNINRLFVLSFSNDENNPTRSFFNKYCMLLVEIKNFNALIENKTFFDRSVKSKQKTSRKLIKMLKNDDYTLIGNVLDNLHHYKFYKLIGTDLSSKTNTTIPQHINFTGK